MHDRGTDVVADRVHALVVALLQRGVVFGRGGRRGELRRQADALERRRDDLVDLELLVVPQGAHRGVEVAQHLVAVLLGRGDGDADRTDRPLHHLLVVLGQVPAAVEDRQ